MEEGYIQRYNSMHMIQKTLSLYKHDYIKSFDTQFRLLPEFVAYDKYFVDPQYGLDTYWDEDLYDQNNLECEVAHNKPND